MAADALCCSAPVQAGRATDAGSVRKISFSVEIFLKTVHFVAFSDLRVTFDGNHSLVNTSDLPGRRKL
jgi:hypothetical protein